MTTGVIVDTDIGYDADDFFALMLLVNSPELSLDLVVTGDEYSGRRARLARRILKTSGHPDVRVVSGTDLGNHNWVCEPLLSEVDEPAADKSTDYLAAIHEIASRHDRVIYIGLQAMSNLSRFITRYPQLVPRFKVYQMGGSLGYSPTPGWVEHNIRIDVPAARHVISSGVDLTFVMAQTTHYDALRLTPNQPLMQALQHSRSQVLAMLWQNAQLFHEYLADRRVPIPWGGVHDPLTVSVAIGQMFVSFEPTLISMNERGEIRVDPDGTPVNVSLPGINAEAFHHFLHERILSGLPSHK